jgi:hypothetical protein
MRVLAAFMLAALLLPALPAAAQTRLSDQYVRGTQRYCSYEDLRPPPAGARERRSYVLQVGRGEPCPLRYSAPLPPRQAPRPRTPLLGQPAGR